MTGEVKFINDCNMPNVTRDVCTFLQTCEIACSTLHQLSVFRVGFSFKLFCYSTVKLTFLCQNKIYQKSPQEKRK